MAKSCSKGRRGLARMFLGGCFLLGGTWAAATAAPPVAKMLEYQPRHESAITTPAAAELAACTVELVKGKVGSGWILKDAQGKILRRFYSSDGRNVDTYSYYRDGVEVYREIVSQGSRAPDQFRWLNTGGSRWGVDEDKNGTIDNWKMISVEEISQEVLRALATRDLARLEACLITEEEVRALGLPTEMAEDIRERRKGIKTKFETTIGKLAKLNEKANWLHLETSAPQCLPSDQTGGRTDILRHARGTVLFESGGASEWFQTGPMILVGATWKLIDAPTPGATSTEDRGNGMGLDDPKLQKLVEELTKLDKVNVASSGKAAIQHHLDRADLLEKIVAVVKPTDREPWIRQVADSLSSAMQGAPGGDATAAKRLEALEKQLVQHMEGSNLTAYVTFRRLQADYSTKLGSNPKNFNDVQKDWQEKLTEFVKAYPRSEDAADALLQLGMVCEFLGKDVEAKNWYSTLAKNYAGKNQGNKGAGAARRLDLEGQPMPLTGPILGQANGSFDITQLQGKLVVVYYWASWNGQAAGDFAKLKALVDGSKGAVEVVCVNLDASSDDASTFLGKNNAPGTHLHMPGGLESKLATQYGVMV
ncbi:MAG: hypothetical protein ACKO23_12775, partial [Gemmataceae bacterium]